ncbi:MAG: polysaccharide biosynthesis/export family protein [Candidatus Omnitrophota bacterium]|nr:polysaccharide biosynthesis/export family protein [Candidatus Omnitrophota bacterium]
MKKIFLLYVAASFAVISNLYAEATLEEITPKDTKIEVEPIQAPAQNIIPAQEQARASIDEYTLGADDVIEIIVRRHPEFSDKFIVNKDERIQYKFVGDIDVSGLTKSQLQKKITGILSQYIVDPDVNITILDYKSKVFYVIGEVGRPGKYYMMGNTVNVREAVVASGLPTMSAAMRKCRLTKPSSDGKPKHININIYEILYGGDLRNNINMQPGDILYVPTTMMAKVMRVISPVSAPISTAVSTGKAVVSAGTMP